MILRLAWAELRNRPGRAGLLFGGYALGVAVMVVLLAVGEAMLQQSRRGALVGGGDVVVVPAGLDPEMVRSGGVSAMYLGIDHARFIQRQVLESPRARQEHGVRAVSPLLDGEPIEVLAGGRTHSAAATGEIPSRAAAAGAAPRLLQGRWRDSDADRRWVNPTPAERASEMDHLHLPAGEAAGDSTWAEWHYFNAVLSEDRWLYLTFMVGGRMSDSARWGGRILLTERSPGGGHRSLARDLPSRQVRFDTTSAELAFGAAGEVRVTPDGAYRVRAEVAGGRLDLEVKPAPRRYFPPTDLGGSALVSGYVAPALEATATGTVCLPRCERVRARPAYHDHNWGIWRGVSWEWGAASDSTLSLLYGVVRGDASAPSGMFAYLVDDLGVRGVFRPGPIQVLRWQRSAGVTIPSRFRFEDPAAGLQVEVEVIAAHVTDMGRPRRRYFVQMRGQATVRERGIVVATPRGFFETYAD